MRRLFALACVLVAAWADAAPMPPTARAESPAPSDVQVDVRATGSGRCHVTVRRHGYLVALRAGERTSAGRDWVGAEIEGPSDGELELGWETTDRSTLETSRGGIRVAMGPDGPRVSSFGLPAPALLATVRERLHECRAFESASSGFGVVCRVARGARNVSAVNLTDESPLSGVATSADRESFVRFDLPLAEGHAESRLLAYLDGNTAVVVRAEASWARGEARPTLSLAGGTRRQLSAPSIRSWVDGDLKF